MTPFSESIWLFLLLGRAIFVRGTMKVISKTVRKAHILYKNRYYALLHNGEETIMVPSDQQGNIKTYRDVGSCIGNIDDFIKNIDTLVYSW